MEHIAIFVLCCFSGIVAYFFVKMQLIFLKRVIYNIVMLLVFGGLMLATGIQEISLLVYILLFALTLLGILMRIVMPIVLNSFGRILSKIQKQSYETQTYEALIQDIPGMHSGVWLFTSVKVLFYIVLVMSLFITT